MDVIFHKITEQQRLEAPLEISYSNPLAQIEINWSKLLSSIQSALPVSKGRASTTSLGTPVAVFK